METKNRITHPASEEIDISKLFQELKSRWRWFLFSFLVLFFAAFVYCKITLPVYKAVSSILIEEKSKTAGKSIDDILLGDLFGKQQNIATETGVLNSKTLKLEVIDKLGLQVGYFNTSGLIERPLYLRTPFKVQYDTISPFIYNTPFYIKIREDKYTLTFEGTVEKKKTFEFSAEATFGDPVISPYFRLRLVRQPEIITEDDEFKFIIYSPSRITSILDENLSIEPLNKDASILVLGYRDNIAPRAVDILNTIGETYIHFDIKDKAAVASLTLKFVEEQLSATTDQLAVIEQELQSFKEKNKTVDLSLEAKAILERLNQAETERVRLQTEMQSLDQLLEYVTENRDMSQLAPSALGIPDPLLVDLLRTYQQLQSKRNSLAYGIKPDAPALKIVDKQIADTREALIENIRSIYSKIKTANQTMLNNIADLELSISRIPETERDLLAIKRKFDVNQNIYLYLLQKKAETSIAKATVVSDNRVLDRAMLLDNPVAPNHKLIFGMAFALSLVFPVITLMFYRLLKTTVSHRDEITALTMLPVTGLIGHLKKADNKAVFHKPRSAIAEAFRSLRTNLQFYGSNENKKVILITSSIAGEGKTFVSINLATVFAMQGHRVVVVGMDLRKPKLYKDFDLENTSGISTYLIGISSLEEIIYKTEIKNLDVITSGPVPPNPAELIAKPETKTLFDELKKRYDLVIVDTPPLGIVSDALWLMNYSDINLFIVRANMTRLDYLRRLEEMNQEGRFTHMSIILNDINLNSQYGYGYNYGYIQNNSGYYEPESQRFSFLRRLLKVKKQPEKQGG